MRRIRKITWGRECKGKNEFIFYFSRRRRETNRQEASKKYAKEQ